MKNARTLSNARTQFYYYIFAFGVIFAMPIILYATPAERDLGFANQGIAQIALASESGAGDVAVQPDGKIVVLGTEYPQNTAKLFLARYSPNGSLDTSFGQSGLVFLSFSDANYSGDLALQPDGHILMTGLRTFGGFSDVFVARFNSNGTPDQSFGGDGIVTIDLDANEQAFGVAVLQDGRILTNVRTSSDQNILVMLAPNGDFDTSFDGDGKAVIYSGTGYIADVEIQSDGKIVAAGSNRSGLTSDPAIDFLVMQFNPNGSPDNSFSGDGKAAAAVGNFADFGTRVELQADEKILVAGTIYVDGSGGRSDFAIVRFNADGSLDTTFDLDGKAVTEVGNLGDGLADFEIQSNGKIVAVGAEAGDGNDYFRPVIVRYLPNGSLDASFDSNGILTEIVGVDAFFNALAIQPDGKLVAAGYNTGQAFLIRYSGEAVAANASITGSVLMQNGLPLRRGQVTLSDPASNIRYSVISPFGYYRFEGLLPGVQYTVKLRSKGWSADTQTVVIAGTSATADFEVVRFP